MPQIKKIIHIDMDCFFAAIEMRDNPQLKHIPLAIGGNQESRGVICTANYEARKYGVRSAMPTSKAMQLCPKLKVLPPRHSYYKEISTEINAIYKRYTSLIEPISLDEAYLDVSENPKFNNSATYLAEDIRKSIFNETGLTASAGIAPLMFLAKIASDMNKPNGIYTISPSQVQTFIQQLELKKIPGVGKVTEKKLAELNLFTCADIQKFSLIELIQNFGKFGQTLWDYAHGIEKREVKTDKILKSISVEHTFNVNLHEFDVVINKLDEQIEELKKRITLKKKHDAIQKIQLKVKFEDFKQTTLEVPINFLDNEKAHELLETIWFERRLGRGVRTLGIGVGLKDKSLNNHDKQLSLALL